MNDFEKVQGIVGDLTRRVQKFHNGDWVTLYCSGWDGVWWATTLHTLRYKYAGDDPIEALSLLERELAEREKDFGYEAAE